MPAPARASAPFSEICPIYILSIILYDSYDEEATDSKPISSYSDAELRKLVKDFSEKELCLLNMYLQMCTQENSYNIEEFRKAKASQSAMTKAETEQAIIKIEDLFKKIGINKALRGQTP